MADEFSAKFPLLVSSTAARDAVGAALRLHVGRGRRYSVKQLANATGVKDWEINFALISAEDTAHRPLKIEALMSISLFLGADFINEWMRLAQVGVFDLPETADAPGVIAADNTDDSAKIVRAAMDGVFDDQETPDLVKVGNRMMQRGAQLVALGRNQPTPDEEEISMSETNQANNVVELKPKDYKRAVQIYDRDIKPAKSKQAEHQQEQSTAHKAIKNECNIQSGAAKAAFKLFEMEESKRDDWLRSFNGLLSERRIFAPHDMVDMAEGKSRQESAVPIGDREEEELPTMAAAE